MRTRSNLPGFPPPRQLARTHERKRRPRTKMMMKGCNHVQFLVMIALLVLSLAFFPVVNSNNIFDKNNGGSGGSPLVLEDGTIETDLNNKQPPAAQASDQANNVTRPPQAANGNNTNSTNNGGGGGGGPGNDNLNVTKPPQASANGSNNTNTSTAAPTSTTAATGEGVTAPTSRPVGDGSGSVSSAVSRNVGFTIDYGFFEEAALPGGSTIAPGEFDGLLAATIKFHTDVLKNAYPETFSTLSTQMTGNEYNPNASDNLPVKVSYDTQVIFIMKGSDGNAVPPPSEEEVLTALENGNYQDYLTDYVWVEYPPDTSTFIFKDTQTAVFTKGAAGGGSGSTSTPTLTYAPSMSGGGDQNMTTFSPTTPIINDVPTTSPSTLAPGQTAPPTTATTTTPTPTPPTGFPDYPDDDFLGDDQCEPLNQALETCATNNDCLKCEEEIAGYAGEGEFDFGGPGQGGGDSEPSLEDFNMMMEQMQTHLNDQCDFFKSTICQLQTCCPSCSKELNDMYTCLSKSLGDSFAGLTDHLGGVIDDVLGNLTDSLGDLLGNLTDAADGVDLGNFTLPPLPPTPSPGSSLPDFDFNCSFDNLQCDALPPPPTKPPTAQGNQTKPPTPAPANNKVTVSSAFILEVKDPNIWDQPETSELLDKAVNDFVQKLEVPGAAASTSTNKRRLLLQKTRQQQQRTLNRLLLRKRSGGRQQQTRQLASVNADSVQIYNLEPVDCSATLQRRQRERKRKLRYLQQGNSTTSNDNNATNNSTNTTAGQQGDCVKVSISYDVNLEEGDDPQQVQQQYETATVDAIQSGSMQQSIDSVAGPNSSVQVVGAAEPAPLPETDAPATGETPPPTTDKGEIEEGEEAEDKDDDGGSSTNILAIVLGVVFGLIGCILLMVAIVFGGSIWVVCAAVCCCCSATKAATDAVTGGGGDDDKEKGEDGEDGEDQEKEAGEGDEENPEEQGPANTTFDQQAEEDEEDGDQEQKGGGAQEPEDESFQSEDDFEENSAGDLNDEQATADDPEDEFEDAGSETFDLSKVSDGEPEDPFDDDGAAEGKDNNDNIHEEQKEDVPVGLTDLD